MKLLAAGLLMAAVFWTAGAPAQSRSPGRPNIIFIMSDDHAAHAIGAYGSRINQTPNLDRIAREGALMTSVFATNAICTPSRASILTGQYSHLNGVTMFNRFDSSRQTVARLLQQGGYYTGMVGKWHLGSDPVGFDRWEILPGQGVYRDPVFYTATGEKTYTGRYVTDVITDLALDFIEHRPRDKPFFLMMHHKAPHRPWEPSEKYATDFATRWIPEPVTFWDSYATRTDALHENLQRVAADLTNRDLKLPPPPGLAAAELTRWLQLKPESVSVTRDGAAVTLTGEALVRWPAGIKARTTSGAMALNIDIAPTFLEAAGLPASPDMQGRSLLPALRGRTPSDWRTSMYYRYYHDPGDHNTRANYGVRTRTHKLIYFWTKNQWELFDLVNDPYELHNLHGQPGFEALTATLKAELSRLKREVRDDDQFANEQFPDSVGGSVAALRGK